MRLAEAYSRFRGSRTFLLALCGAIAASVTAHNLLGFDHDWGITNLSLSMEASISVALLIMGNEKQEAAQRKQLTYMLHLMESIRDLMAHQVAVAVENPCSGRSDPSGSVGKDHQ